MIKTIIFDFGDVFLNLDKPATQRELERHKISNFSEDMLMHNQKYEKGLISSKEFINTYLENYPHLSEAALTNSWNAILKDFPRHRLDFLNRLSQEGQYQLILLSNTNHLHIDWVKDNIPFFEEFKSCFDAFYLSQEINFRKPDHSIYQFVLNTHNLNPAETLFVDDTPENTQAASELGIHTWNIDPAREDVTELFEIKKELF